MSVYLILFLISYKRIGSHATPYEGSAHSSSAVLVQHGMADVQTICRR